MNLMSRLFPPAKQRLRLHAARAAIRRAERSVARRRAPANPGYDELKDPIFISIMTIAALMLVADLLADVGASLLGSWYAAAVDVLRSWS